MNLLSLQDVDQLQLLLEALQQLVPLLLELLVLLQQPLVDLAAVCLLFGLDELVGLQLELRLLQLFCQLVDPPSLAATSALSSRGLPRISYGSSSAGSVLFRRLASASPAPRSSASSPCWCS